MNASMDALGIALSGIQGAQTRVAVSANNVANLLTEDFRPQRVVQTARAGGGTDARVETSERPGRVRLAREAVEQIQASAQYSASARVFEVGAELRGQLVDLFG